MGNASSKENSLQVPERGPGEDKMAENRAGALVRCSLMSSAVLTGLAFLALDVTVTSPVALAAGTLLAWSRWRHLHSLPLKMPFGSGKDPNEWHAGPKLHDAKGVTFLGHDQDGKEMWLTAEDVRHHMLVLGGTGMGKSEVLLGLAANALTCGGGMMFVDGKGDVSTYLKMHALCRSFGREKDLMVVNFMVGNTVENGDFHKSMRMNPFMQGSSSNLTQLIVSLLDDIGSEGGLWKGRAMMMIDGVMKALCWLRDNEALHLDTSVIRNNLGLKRMISISEDDRIPLKFRKQIKSYMLSLPGFRIEKQCQQSQSTLDQHGYLEMQFTRIFGLLSDVYGHVFIGQNVDIDIHDIVKNRRILLVMLPALEKSDRDVCSLAKVLVATLKAMMATSFDINLDTSFDMNLDNQNSDASGSRHYPSNRPGIKSPFLCIMDDVDFYTVDGMAIMTAQARALGFSMCYSSRSMESLKNFGGKEGEAIISSVNTIIRLDKHSGMSDGQADDGALCEGTDGSVTTMGSGKRVDGRIFRLENLSMKGGPRSRVTPLISPIWNAPKEPDADEMVGGF